MLFHLKQQIIKRMELSALQQKVGWNFLIQIFSKTLTTILGIWTLSLISHHLGPSDFGYFYTIFAFVQLASVLTDGGLALITLQDLGRPDLKPKEVLGQQIIFRIGLTLITEGLLLILVFLLPVSAFNNNLKLGIIILSAGNIFIALSQTLATILQKKLKTSYILISEVSGRLILILGVFWFIQKRHHLYVLLVIFIISQAGQMIITFYAANKELTPSWKIDPQYLKKTFQRFWPLAINNLASLLYFKADTLMLSLYHPAEIVGKYGIPYRILETLLTIPAIFLGLLLPLLSKSTFHNQAAKTKRHLQNGWDLLIILALPILGGTIILEKQIIQLLAGPEFLTSEHILPILMLATVFIFLTNLFVYALIAIEKQTKLLPFFVTLSVTAMIVYSYTIPKWGLYGAAGSTLVIEIIIFIVSAKITHHYHQFKPNLKFASQAVGATLIMMGALYYTQTLSVFINVPLGSLVYFLTLSGLNWTFKKR